MPTTVPRFVNTLADGAGNGTTSATTGANGAYPTLHQCLVAEFAARPNLVTNDELLEITCLGSADTKSCSFASYQFTTDDTRFIRVVVDTAHRHDGKYNTSKYRLAPTDTFSSPAININCHVRFEGVQFCPTASMSTGNSGVGLLNNGTGLVECWECIFWPTQTGSGNPVSTSQAVFGTGTSARRAYLRNCLIGPGFYNGVVLQYLSGIGRLVVDNCTFAQYGQAINAQQGGSGRVFLRNNRFVAPTAAVNMFNFTSTTPTTANNYTADASSPDGASFQNKTFTWANAGAGDYHIVAGDTFLGSDLSADATQSFTVDVDGETRVDWYAGFDEFIVVGTELWPLDQSGGDGTDNFGLLQVGGAGPAVTLGPGWLVGNEAAGQYARMQYEAVEVADTAFGATVEPSGAPNGTLGDSFVSNKPLSGKFAAGDWVFTFGLRAEDAGGSQDGRLRLRLWKSGSANMAGATEITSGASATSIATDIAVGVSSTVSVTVALPEVVLNNEYLALQLAWEITGAAS